MTIVCTWNDIVTYRARSLWVTSYILFFTPRVYCLPNLGKADGNPIGNSIISPPPTCIQFSKLWTAEIFSSSNIIIYANIYTYIVFISVNTKLVRIFYVSSSVFIIFTFYYLPFLSSVMDRSCKVPFSIILILTIIECDSFYNSVLTKDWGDVWRGGKRRGLKSLRWVKRNVRRDVCNSSTSIGPSYCVACFDFKCKQKAMYWKRSACMLTCSSAYERKADVIGSASAGNEQQLVRCDHFHMFLEM